jgi:hypothetical protein
MLDKEGYLDAATTSLLHETHRDHGMPQTLNALCPAAKRNLVKNLNELVDGVEARYTGPDPFDPARDDV